MRREDEFAASPDVFNAEMTQNSMEYQLSQMMDSKRLKSEKGQRKLFNQERENVPGETCVFVILRKLFSQKQKRRGCLVNLVFL